MAKTRETTTGTTDYRGGGGCSSINQHGLNILYGTEYYYGRRSENTVDSTVDGSIVVREEEEDEDDEDDEDDEYDEDDGRMQRRGDASSLLSYSYNDNDKKKNDDGEEPQRRLQRHRKETKGSFR